MSSGNLIFDISANNAGRFAVGLVVIMILLPSVLARFRGRWRKAAGYLFIWIGLLLAIVTGHAYQYELSAIANRIIGDLLPGRVMSSAEGEVSVTRRMDGQFAMN